jgi:hypothetical protein
MHNHRISCCVLLLVTSLSACETDVAEPDADVALVVATDPIFIDLAEPSSVTLSAFDGPLETSTIMLLDDEGELWSLAELARAQGWSLPEVLEDDALLLSSIPAAELSVACGEFQAASIEDVSADGDLPVVLLDAMVLLGDAAEGGRVSALCLGGQALPLDIGLPASGGLAHQDVGDYDGDGKTDYTVRRPAQVKFYTIRSSTGQISTPIFGSATDIAVDGDFDGDAKTDYVM